jgi:hypothetical protein
MDDLAVGEAENDPPARNSQLRNTGTGSSTSTYQAGQTCGVDIKAEHSESAGQETFRHRAAHQAQANQSNRRAIGILCRRNNR